MADFDPASDAACEEFFALVRELADGFAADLDTRLAEQGNGPALALAFASLSGASVFLAKAMGAAYAVETMELYASPLRRFLTEHGGPGVSVRQ